jgi:hypothetical protein
MKTKKSKNISVLKIDSSAFYYSVGLGDLHHAPCPQIYVHNRNISTVYGGMSKWDIEDKQSVFRGVLLQNVASSNVNVT